MIAVRRITESGYESGDVVAVVESDHVFTENDLRPGIREAVEIGIITDEERRLLLMEDEELPGAVIGLRAPATGKYLLNKQRLQTKRRRKYKLDGLNIVKKQ